MKAILAVLLVVLFFSSKAQKVVGNYKLKYLTYFNDTIDANDTAAVKALFIKIAKSHNSNPNVTSVDSMYMLPLLLDDLKIERTYSYNFKDDFTVYIGGVNNRNVVVTKYGKYSVKGESVKMKAKSDYEVERQVMLVNGEFAIMRKSKMNEYYGFDICTVKGFSCLSRKVDYLIYIYRKE